MALIPVPVIKLDGHYYAVMTDTYTRSWQRQFTWSISAATIQVNFVDRGPGIRKYNMSVLLCDWATTSAPYLAGVTESVDTQRSNLEASYQKIATALSFTDPFGNRPLVPGSSTTPTGVFFTNLVQSIPKYSVKNRPYIAYEIEVMDSTSEVN